MINRLPSSRKTVKYYTASEIDEIHKYFDVLAVIRRKRSGTGYVAKS